MGLFNFKRPAEYFSVSYNEDMIHGPWNNYECDNPDCICHDRPGESTSNIPVPWEELQEQDTPSKKKKR